MVHCYVPNPPFVSSYENSTGIRTTKRDELQEEEPKCIAPPPTAQTTGAIEFIFWLEVHQADTNGATVAISEFPSQTGDIDHLLISAKVPISAIWSSFF